MTSFTYQGYLINTLGCKTPFIDTSHPGVQAFLPNVTRGESFCHGQDSPVLFGNFNVPLLDEWILKHVYQISTKVSCQASEVGRDESSKAPDRTVSYGPVRVLRFGEPLLSEYVRVTCLTGNVTFYEGYHMIAQKKLVARRENWHEKMNVLVLGVDSLSRLNFNRLLTRTGEYVRKTLGAFELLGYNKVGDNSFPNQLPLLTGLSGVEAEDLATARFHDGLTYLWDLYKKTGHQTMFLEEQPTAGLFTFPNKKGFLRAPTDYYSRPIMLAISPTFRNVSHCAGSRLKTERVLEYVADVTHVMGDDPFFAYVWLSDMVHENPSWVAYLDDPLTEFLEELATQGILNNTILAFLSDHGMRGGPFRRTPIGSQENKTPFCFLRFPPWFLERFPVAAAALDTNRHRLTTPYDIHATIANVAALPNFEPEDTAKGLSLFREVPSSRTCEEAFIPIQFCSCLFSKTASEDAAELSYATYFINYLNAVAELHFPGKCLPWSMQHVDGFQKLGNHTKDETMFWLQVTTEPEAHFEVYGNLSRESDQWRKHIHFVDRMDRYSNFTYCLPASRYQKYCVCRDTLSP